MKRKRLLSQQESLKLAQQLDSVSSIMSPSKKKNATRISTPIQQPMNHQTNVSGRREVFHQKQNNSMAYNRTLPIYDAETSLNNNHYGFTKISPHGKGNTSTPQPPHHRTLEGGDGGSDGGKPGPGTDHPPLFDCENYFLFEDCISNATVGYPRVFSESEAAYGEMVLCVGEKHEFVVYIALTNGNYRMILVCLDDGMILAMQDFPQPITIKKIEWSCEGALPAKGEGFTYEPAFPEVGTYQVKATVHINPPELCYSGKLILNASPKLVHAVVVESITSFNGYSDGQILPYGGHKEINLQANLSTPPENFKPDWLDWEVSPSEAGVLKPIPELPEEAIFRKFIPNEEFMGEVTIYAKLCPEYWGAEFHLKIVGGIRVSGDKDILCAGHEDIINLKATTDISGISGEQISWNLKPKEAGRLTRATGYRNKFISNSEYVSSKYKDIAITAALFDEKDDFKATCASFTLKSQGVKKNEFSDEKNGINPPQDGPWNPKLEGRLFVDTNEEWVGPCIDEKSFDKQRVLFYVEVTPNENEHLGIENLEVDWELFDPDDPANEPLIDPYPRYQPSKDPFSYISSQDTEERGVDNTGIPHEADSHWLTGGNTYRKENFDEKFSLTSNEIIGKARGKFIKKGDKLSSSVYFNFSDHGGDNFILKAILYDTKRQRELCSIDTGKLTVWRKRCAQVMAMSRKEPEEGNFYPLEPIPLCAYRLRGEKGEEKIYSLNQGFFPTQSSQEEKFFKKRIEGWPETSLRSMKVKTIQENSEWSFELDGKLYIIKREGDDLSFYFQEEYSKKNDPILIRDALLECFFNDEADQNAYIDFHVVNSEMQTKVGTPLALHYEKKLGVGELLDYINDYVMDLNLKGEVAYSSYFTIIGIDTIAEYAGFKAGPFCFIGVGSAPSAGKNDYESTSDSLKNTICHEVGHLLVGHLPTPRGSDLSRNLDMKEFYQSLSDIHHDYIFVEKKDIPLKDKEKWEDYLCHFTNQEGPKGRADRICERHVRLIRNSTKRYFWYRDTAQLTPSEKLEFENGQLEREELQEISFTHIQLYD